MRRAHLVVLLGLFAVVTSGCGLGGRVGYRFPLRPQAAEKNGLYGGPMLFSFIPADSHFAGSLSAGYNFAPHHGFGWLTAEGMQGKMPATFGDATRGYLHGGAASIQFSMTLEDDGIYFAPAICGHYIGEANADQMKGWWIVEGSGCVRWAVNQWLGFDLGGGVALPPTYAG